MSLSGRCPSISFGYRSFARTPHWGDSLLRNRKTFQRLLVLFSRFSAGTSEVILLSQRLALKYNTIHPPVWQPLFSTFLPFFLGSAFLPVFCMELAPPLTRWIQQKGRAARMWAALPSLGLLYWISQRSTRAKFHKKNPTSRYGLDKSRRAPLL